MPILSNEDVNILQETIDTVNQLAPFSSRVEEPQNLQLGGSLRRGYLMQSVSRGQQARVALISRRHAYRVFKIDLAGVIYLNHPDGDSKFQLRFTREGDTWFDTDILTVEGLTIVELLRQISQSAPDSGLPLKGLTGALGHPTQHSLLVKNSDLYPELPDTYKDGDMIDSLTGSWIFGIHRSLLPREDTDFDVQLLFTVDGDDSVQLNGPAVMTIHEIRDCPTGQSVNVTDVMEVAQPTPLRGGSLVVLGPFDDVGYGIIAANPREYLFQLDYQ